MLSDGALLWRDRDPPRRLGELLRRHGGAPIELGLGGRGGGGGGGHVQVLAHLLLLAHAAKLV